MKDFFHKHRLEVFFVVTAVAVLIIFIALMGQIDRAARFGGMGW